MLVVRMLQTIVLLIGHRMGQMNPIAFLLEQIRQPVPIIRRFHNNPFQLGLVRLEKTANQLGIVRKLPIDEMLSFLIDKSRSRCYLNVDPFHSTIPYGTSLVRLRLFPLKHTRSLSALLQGGAF